MYEHVVKLVQYMKRKKHTRKEGSKNSSQISPIRVALKSQPEPNNSHDTKKESEERDSARGNVHWTKLRFLINKLIFLIGIGLDKEPSGPEPLTNLIAVAPELEIHAPRRVGALFPEPDSVGLMSINKGLNGVFGSDRV